MASKSLNFQRIQRELKEVLSEDIYNCGIFVEVVNDNFMDLKAQIAGPPETPYEGGVFMLQIKVPNNYPFEPPAIKFITKIWHPNICPGTGKICLDTLQDQWAATFTMRTVLLSLQELLRAPEPDDPLTEDVGRQYINNYEMFRQTARHWTQVYAGAPGSNPDFDEKINRLMELGLPEDEVRAALSSRSWDLEEACRLLGY